jgi:flagellar basal-body rod protein FlgB
MLPSLFSASTIPVLEQVVNFSEARHNVLAGNIANMDTPGYKAVDLSPVKFQAQLKAAVESQHYQSQAPADGVNLAGVITTTTFSGGETGFDDVRESMHSLTYLDDSDVDMERQVAELTKNQVQHNLALTIMTSQFRQLQAAISERA